MKTLFALLSAVTLAAACGGTSGANLDDRTQFFPTSSQSEIQAWLDGGAYKQWNCQATTHASDLASGHPTKARICSNDALSAHGSGEYPVGAANVKEIFDAADLRIGTTVYGKIAKTTATHNGFFYFGAGDLVAFGPGSDATVKATCVDCHGEAGVTTTFGHDFVYVQVK